MNEEQILKAYHAGIGSVISTVKDMHIELTTEITFLNTKILSLETENKILSLKLAELEARLNKNSTNSSKPPSSDGYKKNVTNSRKKTDKKTGGQAGHVGKTLLKVDTPDEIIDTFLPTSCHCGADLNSVEDHMKTRQVFDIPEIKIKTTEYRTHEKVCPICGEVHRTEFPVKVSQPVQYGEKIQSLTSYLTTYQLLPLERAVETIEDLCGQKISQGTIVNMNNRLYKLLEKPVEAIKEQLKASPVIHVDESGIRVDGSTKWVHVASTPDLTYYAVNDKRGKVATEEIGIMSDFTGTAVHDHWKPYYTFTNCTHAECNAHNLRYLREISENFDQEWAQMMASLLVEIKNRVGSLKEAGVSSMDETECNTWFGRYHCIINNGILEDSQKSPTRISEKTGKPLDSKALNLLQKLKEYDIETLAFMFDFEIPFDNNLAERDIRMQKLRQKISGCFRGDEGAKVFCLIRSYVSTAKKNGVKAMTAIKNAFQGTPFVVNAQ